MRVLHADPNDGNDRVRIERNETDPAQVRMDDRRNDEHNDVELEVLEDE